MWCLRTAPYLFFTAELQSLRVNRTELELCNYLFFFRLNVYDIQHLSLASWSLATFRSNFISKDKILCQLFVYIYTINNFFLLEELWPKDYHRMIWSLLTKKSWNPRFIIENRFPSSGRKLFIQRNNVLIVWVQTWINITSRETKHCVIAKKL